jgi:hypothetical protein
MARLKLLVGLLAIFTGVGNADADERDRPAASLDPRSGSARESAPAALIRLIDQRIDARLKSERIPASAVADDAEFVRRVYLDLHGVVPTAARAQSFFEDRDENKRAKLIDQLLAESQFATHLADIWDDYLIPDTDDTRANKQRLTAWLEEAFLNKPWDRITQELLTASGQRDKDAATLYLFKGRETLSPAELTDLVSQYFVGIRLNCAQCHDHPFTDWKQSDYWGMAAFFTEIQYTDRRLLKSGVIRDDPAVALDKLEDAAKLRTPKFLGGVELTMQSGVPRRAALAQWLTAADNPYFARAMVNRMWALFFGRGLVNPPDDMHEDNAATHPELLDEMSKRFIASGFDLRDLCRAICNSAAYQRTSMPVPGNAGDATWYSRMAIKVLTPEQLYDSLSVVVPATRERKRADRNMDAREEFVRFFRSEGDPNPMVYDRGIPQALRMMNSPQRLPPHTELATVPRMIDARASDDQAIDRLYLHMLTRQPTEEERKIHNDFLSRHPGARDEAYAEIVWSLLNSSEFSLNH